jgi:hypothetical protein
MVAPASGRFASAPVNDKEGNRWFPSLDLLSSGIRACAGIPRFTQCVLVRCDLLP